MTTPDRDIPQYRNMPVILVHLSVDPVDGLGPKMLWCAPYEYVTDTVGSFPTIPRVMCPGCQRAIKS